jgi:hypothetical protein
MPSVVITKERTRYVYLSAGHYVYGSEELILDINGSDLEENGLPFAEIFDNYNERVGDLTLKEDGILYTHDYLDNGEIKHWSNLIPFEDRLKCKIKFNPLYFLVLKQGTLDLTQK